MPFDFFHPAHMNQFIYNQYRNTLPPWNFFKMFFIIIAIVHSVENLENKSMKKKIKITTPQSKNYHFFAFGFVLLIPIFL